jgi:hypothetical protein
MSMESFAVYWVLVGISPAADSWTERPANLLLEKSKLWPYKDAAQRDRYINDLRKAGLPE